MNTVWFVHGIREAPWDQPSLETLADLIAYPPGWDGRLVNYGYRFLPATNTRAVNELLEVVKPGDVVLGYSNGAWAALQAAELGCPIAALVLVNPALHLQHEFPCHVEAIDVFYCPDDTAVLLGRLWRRLTRLLPWRWRNPHGWGAMGRYGYTGKDPRVMNWELAGDPGHGSVRSTEALLQLANHIEDYTRGKRRPLNLRSAMRQTSDS